MISTAGEIPDFCWKCRRGGGAMESDANHLTLSVSQTSHRNEQGMGEKPCSHALPNLTAIGSGARMHPQKGRGRKQRESIYCTFRPSSSSEQSDGDPNMWKIQFSSRNLLSLTNQKLIPAFTMFTENSMKWAICSPWDSSIKTL